MKHIQFSRVALANVLTEQLLLRLAHPNLKFSLEATISFEGNKEKNNLFKKSFEITFKHIEIKQIKTSVMEGLKKNYNKIGIFHLFVMN